MNGLSLSPADYVLLYRDNDGTLKELPGQWTLCAEGGEALEETQTLSPQTMYEVRFSIADGSQIDLSDVEYQGTFSVMLAAQ